MNNEQIIRYEETDESLGTKVKKPPVAIGVFSMVFGILSILSCPLGLIGVILGVLGARLGRPIPLVYPKTGAAKLGTAGKITGSIGAVLSILAFILECLAVVIAICVMYMYM